MICGLILASGAYPLAIAWRANRATTLRHALVWACAAGVAWVLAFFLADYYSDNAARLARYVALCLTSCAAVAVLGARRPGVTAWNFVVLAQLALLLLPLAEGLGDVRLDPLRLIFLGGTLMVGFLNYLPTRLAAAVMCGAIGCGVEIALLRSAPACGPLLERVAIFSRCLLAASPWIALVAVRALPSPPGQFDRLWIGFRDRFGLVWGQRVREQFNRAAIHAGWPVVLHWGGLRASGMIDDTQHAAMAAALRALLKRFGSDGVPGEGGVPS
jgi:hypothetical protein